MRAITQHLKKQGYDVTDDAFYLLVHQWTQWYKGLVPQFHQYRQYNGLRKITRTRAALGMAKKVCEDWANLALNEKVEITISNGAVHQAVHDVLEANSFRTRANQLLELAFALGTGAFVEYRDQDAVQIDYIRAGMIYPLAWENGEITSCAFASERQKDNRKYVYLNSHVLEGGQYVIRNEMFLRSGDNLTPAELPEGVQAEFRTGSGIPLFQIIKPNCVNNLLLESNLSDIPMGISVYANALDVLRGLDLVYDSYCNEFRLGKKRILVPASMAQMAIQDSGIVTPMFDDNDTEFFAFRTSDTSTVDKPIEINMELRTEAHEQALKTNLNLLSAKCGLGNDRYNFERGSVKTATEVVSEKSELYQNLKKHELLLEKALQDLCRAVAVLLGITADFKTEIRFDDSIIEDKNASMQRDMQLVRDRLMQPWEFRVKYFGETREAAEKVLGEQQSDDDYMGFRREGE